MKQTKTERDFFKDFDDVQITDVEQEVWERFVVPLSRYELKEDDSK